MEKMKNLEKLRELMRDLELNLELFVYFFITMAVLIWMYVMLSEVMI
jgi:hypothetical protein